MNKIDIASGLLFQKMGLSKETPNDRSLCQAKVYLLQALGTNLGFSFVWHKGPYSPTLADYVYSNLDFLLSEDFSKYKMRKAAQDNVTKVNALVHEAPSSLSTVLWYRLLSSLLFMDLHRQSWKIGDSNDPLLFTKLVHCMPQYTQQQCKYAFGILRRYGFVKNNSFYALQQPALDFQPGAG